MRLTQIITMSGCDLKIGDEWNDLFVFLFKSDVCLYAHRRDDIDFELGWLYEVYISTLKNNLNHIESSIASEHLFNFLYFLRTTTK